MKKYIPFSVEITITGVVYVIHFKLRPFKWDVTQRTLELSSQDFIRRLFLTKCKQTAIDIIRDNLYNHFKTVLNYDCIALIADEYYYTTLKEADEQLERQHGYTFKRYKKMTDYKKYFQIEKFAVSTKVCNTTRPFHPNKCFEEQFLSQHFHLEKKC